MNTQRVEQYQRIRQVCKEYLSDLLNKDKYPEADPVVAGKLLGIYRSGKIVFSTESEVSTLMDFSIAEKIFNGKSQIDREIESGLVVDEYKHAILEAFRSGYTSLFEVLGNVPADHTVQLYDLLKDEDKEIIDINLSRSIDKSKLLFFRILSFKEFAMSSGATFAFSSKHKDVLLRRYRSEIRSRFVIDKSVTRFLVFHRLNRDYGEDIILV